MRIEVGDWIAAAPERVFRVATDIPRWPTTVAAIARFDMPTPGPVALGTRFRETRTMFGREATQGARRHEEG